MGIKHKLLRLRSRLEAHPDVRGFLLESMPKGGVCAEVGSWKGEFSSRILVETDASKLYLIDPYQFVESYENAWYGGIAGSQDAMDAVYESVRQKFHKEIGDGRVEMVRKPSKEGLASLPDSSLDWVYIDGNHMYEFVKQDLEGSWPKVKVGGYVSGDDYNLSGWWDHGVTKAVDEFIKKKKGSISEVTFKSTQFFFKKIAE